MASEKHIAFIDHVGRNIFGKQISETEDTITVSNPIIVHCQPSGDGKIQVQNIPLFFFEFIKQDQRDKNNWTFSKSSIITSDVVLADHIIKQYDEVNKPVQAATNNPKVIQINDL